MLVRVNPAILFLFILFGMPLSSVSAQNVQQTTAPPYSDTSDGLRDFLQAFIDAIKNADLEKRTRMEKSLRLPKPQDWFTTTYGRQAGRRMADNYIGNPPQLYPYIDSCHLDRPMKIQVSHVEFPDDQSAKLSGIPLLRQMRLPVAFYTAYLTYGEGGRCIIYPVFVYAQQAFRVLNREFGKMDERERPHCGLEHLFLHMFPVDERIMQEKLLPPDSALPFPLSTSDGTAHTETLLVSIACDGTVLETDYLDGPPELFGQAARAVMKRRYWRTFMNGLPAEVSTTVTINLEPKKIE
jgi:hypothetical protein